MTTVADVLRKCPQCGVGRELTAFISGGSRAACATCRAKNRELASTGQHPSGVSVIRARHLWKAYRITPEEFETLRVAQDYRCAICRTHEDEIEPLRSGRRRLDGSLATPSFRLVVDHCHDSTRIRGLLCQPCNVAIGCAKDSPEILRAAIAYLEAAANL